MAEKIVNIQSVDSKTFEFQSYTAADENNISHFNTDVVFDAEQDYIEYFVLDSLNSVIYSNINGVRYTLQDTNVVIDPQRDIEAVGFNEGQYFTTYNFLRKKLNSSPIDTFFIQEISPDRTELRLDTTQIDASNLSLYVPEISEKLTNLNGTYSEFYLNLGDNKLLMAVNMLLDNSTPSPTVLIKLYQPLPRTIFLKTSCWVVEKVAESQAYDIEMHTTFDSTIQLNYIGGPNTNLNIQNQINNSSAYLNQSSLTQTPFTLGSGSLFSQLNSLLIEKGIEINVDYSDYSNFIHFSSAQTRLENFYYKLSLIEQYSTNSNVASSSISNYNSGSQVIWNNKINDIITNFDGYEYYLYFESGSSAWPKLTSTPPYKNVLTTSGTAISYLSNQTLTASLYDSDNKDALTQTIPSYLREDTNNANYELFVQMLGQHFDNVWIYIKDITNKFDNDNRLNYGISKDIVAQAIRDLGVKIYQNNFSEADIYSSLIGLTPSGSALLLPFTTGSLPTPEGFEYINTYVTSSATNSILPLNDVNKEIYKRIYHNLPILLKKKGTPEGLRLLINIYGIPDTILKINEFGGKSNSTLNTWDNFNDQFNYSFYSAGTGWIKTSFTNSFDGSQPNTIEFRFKTNGIPSVSPYYQTLLKTDSFAITLNYTGSRYTSGSYRGSIPDPYNNYGTVNFIDLSTNLSSSIYLPFFNNDWWSLMYTKNNTTQTIYSKNKIYSGYDGSNIGFKASSSLITTLASPTGSLYLSFTGSTTIGGKVHYRFSGSFQELRLYNTQLSQSAFDDYVMNPYSIESNQLSGSQSSYNSLTFRAPLGTMLDNNTESIVRTSIHPSISQIPNTQSFSTGNSTYYLSGSFSFVPNNEVIYQDQFSAGIKNATTKKIKIVNNFLPAGDTLSQYISVQQLSYNSESCNNNINYVEVAFSPQDEINDDIISQLGSFNIGYYIGDPREVSSSLNYYPSFNKLRDEYFSKYTNKYNLWDYIRLIKNYDNSLFKMIKDFTPARTSLATGIIIKPTLLERCKYPLPQMTTNSVITYVGSPTSKKFNIQY